MSWRVLPKNRSNSVKRCLSAYTQTQLLKSQNPHTFFFALGANSAKRSIKLIQLHASSLPVAWANHDSGSDSNHQCWNIHPMRLHSSRGPSGAGMGAAGAGGPAANGAGKRCSLTKSEVRVAQCLPRTQSRLTLWPEAAIPERHEVAGQRRIQDWHRRRNAAGCQHRTRLRKLASCQGMDRVRGAKNVTFLAWNRNFRRHHAPCPCQCGQQPSAVGYLKFGATWYSAVWCLCGSYP